MNEKEKVVNLITKFTDEVCKVAICNCLNAIINKKEVDIILNKTIKKVTEDIENFKFNTAISQLMICFNEMEKRVITRKQWEEYLKLLAPFAPHMAEELWERLGNKESIFKSSWSKHDEELVKDKVIKFVVQINGKVRDIFDVEVDTDEDKIKKVVFLRDKVKKWTDGKKIIKTIIVKNKLINIVF